MADFDDLGFYGLTTFDGNAVYLTATLPEQQWPRTLVRELLHVLRGRFTDVEAEEAHIESVVAGIEKLLADVR